METSISVVICNYNYGAFVGDAIRSALNQERPVSQLVLVDDGSTDDSLDVMRRTVREADKPDVDCRIIPLPDNVGKLAALNRALPEITGTITIILDADDVLSPEYTFSTCRALEDAHSRDPSVAFVYTDCTLVDEHNTFLSRGKSTAFDKDLIQVQSYIPECAPTFTSVLKSVGPFSVEIRKSTKHHKWVKIIESGWTGVYLQEPLFRYRMHQRNISSIGIRIKRDIAESGGLERMLSGYWGTTGERKMVDRKPASFHTDHGRIVTNVERASRKAVNQIGTAYTGFIIDRLGKSGSMSRAIKNLRSGMTMCGTAVTALGADLSVRRMAINLAQPGDVLVVAAGGVAEYACFGDGTAKKMMLKGMVGAVIDGSTRDAGGIAELGFPTFVLGATPKNYDYPIFESYGAVNVPIVCGGQLVCPGDVILADDDGVVVIPRATAEAIAPQIASDVVAERRARSNLDVFVPFEVDEELIARGYKFE